MTFISVMNDSFAYEKICKFCQYKILCCKHTCYKSLKTDGSFSIHFDEKYVLLNKYYGTIAEDSFVIKTNYISYRQFQNSKTPQTIYAELFDIINSSLTIPDLHLNLKTIILFS